MANGIEQTREFQIAHQKVQEEKRRQDEALHREPPRNSRPKFEAMAFNIGLTSDEMHAKISEDPEFFKKVHKLATKKKISYEEAERRLKPPPVDPMLPQKIKMYQNSNRPKQLYPDEPRPQSIYVNPHESHNTGYTKGQLEFIANSWLKWKITPSTINSEPATPLDEFPEITRQEEEN